MFYFIEKFQMKLMIVSVFVTGSSNCIHIVFLVLNVSSSSIYTCTCSSFITYLKALLTTQCALVRYTTVINITNIAK